MTQEQANSAFKVVTDLLAGTWPTVVIAFVTFAMFVLQYYKNHHEKKVQRANYQLALFEKRMEVYSEIQEFLHLFMRDIKPSIEQMFKLRKNTENAHFLFPKTTLNLINEIADKSISYRYYERVSEPLRERAFNGENLTEEEMEKKEISLNKMRQIESWFNQQIEGNRLRKEFERFLSLPDSL